MVAVATRHRRVTKALVTGKRVESEGFNLACHTVTDI
jgi:hypothetical protein